MSKANVMPTEHKGGIIFDYWVSNPWLNHKIKDAPVPAAPGISLGRPAEVTTLPTLPEPLTGVVTGAHGPDNDTRFASDDTIAPTNEVMKDSPTDCKLDHVDIEDKNTLIIDGTQNEREHHPTDDVSKAGVDDSVIIRTAKPRSARNPRASDVRVMASPQSTTTRNRQTRSCNRTQYTRRRWKWTLWTT